MQTINLPNYIELLKAGYLAAMKIASLLLCFLSLPMCLQAQEDTTLILSEPATSRRAFLDIVPELEIGFPLDDFREKMNRTALVGKGIAIFYRFEKQPLDVGLRFGGLTYDKVRWEFTEIIDGIEEDWVQKTKNKMWLLHGAVRFEPPVKFPPRLRPYLEGTVGAQRLFTKTFTRQQGLHIGTVDDESRISPRFDRTDLNSEWGWSFSGAAGVKIVLERRHNTAIDLQIGYRQGMTGDFYVRDPSVGVQPEPEDNLLLRRAALSMLSIKLGLSFLGYDVE